MKKLTRKGFKAWLESQSPRKVVGHSCRSRDCPIARFLAEGNSESVWVYQRAFTIGPRRFPMRDWIKRFIKAIDTDLRGSPVERHITAAHALRVLDEAK